MEPTREERERERARWHRTLENGNSGSIGNRRGLGFDAHIRDRWGEGDKCNAKLRPNQVRKSLQHPRNTKLAAKIRARAHTSAPSKAKNGRDAFLEVPICTL